jgi:hypothetical protein
MASLSSISPMIQKNTMYSVPDININVDYIQTETIPETIKPDIVSDVSTFKFNEIIEIPDYLHFLDVNNYYLYGTSNMFHSVLFIIDEGFRLGSIGKQERLENFRDFLMDNINSSFLRNKILYTKQNIKKKTIEIYLKELLFSKKIENNLDVFNLIADTNKLNIYILDPNKQIYYTYSGQSNSDPNIVLIILEEHVVPLLSIHDCFFSNSDIDKILSYFSPKLFLNKISSYKLSDLQLLANNNTISITNDKNKPKNKQQLYDNLLLLT